MANCYTIEYRSKPTASALVIGVTILTMLFAFFIYYRTRIDKLTIFDHHAQKNEGKSVRIRLAKKFYNIAYMEDLGNEECVENVDAYYRNICEKLFIEGIIMLITAILLIITPNKVPWEIYTYFAAVITTTIYIVFVVFDFFIFDFNQKERMAVHDAWKCKEITVGVPESYGINFLAYFLMAIVHALGAIVNLMMFVGDFWTHRKRGDKGDNDDGDRQSFI